jgi:hypothetical protein
MQKYQVKKYFEWGPLRLEPYQYLTVETTDMENCYRVTRESTKENFFVHSKALESQEKLETIAKV